MNLLVIFFVFFILAILGILAFKLARKILGGDEDDYSNQLQAHDFIVGSEEEDVIEKLRNKYNYDFKMTDGKISVVNDKLEIPEFGEMQKTETGALYKLADPDVEVYVSTQ